AVLTGRSRAMGLRRGLEVRADDVLHVHGFGAPPELVEVADMAGPVLPQGFQRHVEPHLASEAEAVSDGLSWAEHTDGHLLDDVLLNPSRERLARHADGTERCAIELRLPDVVREREPDLEGRLRREVV